jgi:para-aminobenzoate synthetase component 1
MKGTIDAGIMNASDEILNNRKEAAEHATIVDLIRNDLAMVADHVKVEDYRFIDKITTHQGDLLQVSSKISGQLTDGFYNHLGDILFKLLPAGSISGAPKPKTLRIIQQAETYQRGFYTGIMGYFDGENIDSGVMIRFIEQTANGLIFKSGGGITCLSKAREEYDEMVRKVYLPF